MFNDGMVLSIKNETFAEMKNDFDAVLGRTLGNMQMRGANEATITLKVNVTLEKVKVTQFDVESADQIGEIARPVFKHDINSVMQIKDRMSGVLKGEYEIVYDEEQEAWVMVPIRSRQMNMFDDDFETGGDTADGNEVLAIPEEVEVPFSDPYSLEEDEE